MDKNTDSKLYNWLLNNLEEGSANEYLELIAIQRKLSLEIANVKRIGFSLKSIFRNITVKNARCKSDWGRLTKGYYGLKWKIDAMDEDQRFAFGLAINGHNLVITGQAGTGKTYLVRKIVNFLRYNQKKNVTIACSTGIAATHYGDLKAQTLHRWEGIVDGRYLNDEIVHLVKTDERFESANSHILTTDTLIIDEISMISAKVFHQVQVLCKRVREFPHSFGNIQVILVGDFYQLPPVANELYGDPGNMCFRLPWFESYFPHKIDLKIVHRQDEQTLINCINELAVGEPSDESVAFLNSLSRPIENSVQLFARNIDVDLYNYNKVKELPGDLQVYKSTDEGSQHYLNRLSAPKNLGLKVGCPVMLVKNLTDSLVNGIRGTVLKLHEKSVDVNFDVYVGGISTTANIKQEIFSTFDPVEKNCDCKKTSAAFKSWICNYNL